MICVRSIRDGFRRDGIRCDMCFQRANYEIMADDRYNELPAFCLHLCKAHAGQFAKNISDAINLEKVDKHAEEE